MNRLTPFALASLLAAPAIANDSPTYSRDVAPILNENCVSCHRPGESAPMSLMNYDEVRPWAKSIARNVGDGAMPPWHANPEYGAFSNDRSLSPEAIDTVVSWVQAGAPAGDLADLPATPDFPAGGWLLGEPDLIVELPVTEVPASERDQFEKLVGRVMLKEDRWITAVEVMPGNRKVVHHVIAIGIKGFDIDPAEGWLGAWAAGTEPMVFPEGTGRFFPAGSNILADMHYHPADGDQTDATRIGLHFAKNTEGLKHLANIWVQNDDFEIPAGEANHEVRATYTIWQDGKIMGLIPHMHYRGKDFTFTARYPDGTSQILLNVPNYDFGWQTNYMVAEPIQIPAGTVIETVAHYDNSTGNLNNPDPTRAITFGNESYDEMNIGFVDFIVDEGVAMKPLTEIRRELLPQIAASHPGEVYAVTAGAPENVAPLYLPRAGEGSFHVIYDGSLTAARVWDIVWQGNEFTATVQGPSESVTIPLKGTLMDSGAIETFLGETPFNGGLFEADAATATSSL